MCIYTFVECVFFGGGKNQWKKLYNAQKSNSQSPWVAWVYHAQITLGTPFPRLFDYHFHILHSTPELNWVGLKL